MTLRLLFAFLIFAAGTRAPWRMVAVRTTASLRGLSVVDEKIVWASGTDGTVLRTGDGGKTWQARPVAGAEKLDFRGVWAFDAETAVVMSSGKAEEGMARIYRTSDAGEHWTVALEAKTPGIFFNAVAFWDREHGIVLSDPVEGRFVLYVTADGGRSWKPIAPEKMPRALENEGGFAASNSCLTVQGGKNVWFGTGGASVARVFRSTDGGQSWNVAETPMRPTNASSGIFSVAFRDALRGVASGGDYAHPESSVLPNWLTTSDGGKNWSAGESTKPAGIYFSSILSLDGLENSSGARGGRFLAGGIAGIFLLEPGTGWVEEQDGEFNAIAGGRSGKVWAIGPKGRVAEREQRKDLTQS